MPSTHQLDLLGMRTVILTDRPEWPDQVARVVAFQRDTGTRYIIAASANGNVTLWAAGDETVGDLVSFPGYPGVLTWTDLEISAGHEAAKIAKSCLD
jgi:hypothetical protein